MTILKRIWNRLSSIPVVRSLSLIFEEKWQEINIKKQYFKVKEFQVCSKIEEFFNFSSQEFGPHQIKAEILAFLNFVQPYTPKYVCEIGTADGGTNFLLSQALSDVKLMIGIDLFVKNKSKLSLFCKSTQEIRFVNGSSYDDRTVNKVKQILGDRQLDLLFIDGDHNYEGVKKDFLKYRHLVRDGGIIVFHDIIPDHFTKYGVKTGRWAGGVPVFWNEIKASFQHWEFVENVDQDGLGIGAIQYSSQVDFTGHGN